MPGPLLLPKDSGVLGLGVLGHMVLGADYTHITDLTTTYRDHNYLLIEIYTDAMVLCGVVDDFESFTYTENWYDLDTWTIEINRYKTNVAQFTVGRFIKFISNGREYFGLIESLEKPLDPEGKGSEKWTVSGRGVEAIFAQRICLTNTDTKDGGGYADYSGVAETVMRTIVDNECISATDTSRNFTGLSLAADTTLGATVDRSLRFDYVSDALYGIVKETGISFRLVHGTGLDFVMTFYEGSDVSATVTITPDYGNVAAFRYVESLLEYKNLLYVGGTGDAALRTVREVYDTTEPEGWDRREKFIDATDCSTNDLLDARGAEVLATTSVSVSLSVEYIESPTYTLGTDFSLGDTVTVLFEDVATLVSRIVSVTYQWDTDGKRITLGVGKEAPDLVSIIKLDRRLNSAQQRR